MDDFLHNLRSGKLKQHDRGRRDYNDYKGPQRRAGSERRRPDYYAKITGENFGLVKASLDSLAEQQRRIADAIAARTDTESRIANALESIAAMLNRQGNIDVPSPSSVEASETGDSVSPVDASLPAPAQSWDTSGGKLADEDRSRLQAAIASMRHAGHSWEKVARQLIEQGVPTVTGKGIWRGPAVKKIWDADTGALGA